MKKYIQQFKNLPDNTKRTVTIVLVFIIGVSLIGLITLYNNSKTAVNDSSFRTLNETVTDPTPEGEVAGESDMISTPSPTLKSQYYRTYASLTPTRPPVRNTASQTRTTTTSGSSNTSTVSTSTPTSGSSGTTATATTTPKPTSTSVPVTSVPNTPTPGPTNTPVPAPTNTPTPGPSLSVGVNEGTINATATVFGEIHVCIFHFRRSDNIALESKNGSISGDKTSCSTDTSDNPDIAKVVAYLGTQNGTVEVEKSRPF